MSECRRKSRGGYTLIELLLVVALLGLAGSLLVPQLTQRQGMELQAAVRKVIGDLSFAQSDALARQEFRRVHFYDDGSGYCIVRVDQGNYADAWDAATADYVTDPLNPADYIVDFVADSRFAQVVVSSVAIDDGGRDIIYDPLGGTIQDGGVPGTGGTIELTSDTEVIEIVVSPFTGKLTVIE